MTTKEAPQRGEGYHREERTWKSRLRQWKSRRCDQTEQSPLADLQLSSTTTPSPLTPSGFVFPPSPAGDHESTRLGPLVPTHFAQSTNSQFLFQESLPSNSSFQVRPDSPILGPNGNLQPQCGSWDRDYVVEHNAFSSTENGAELQLPIQATNDSVYRGASTLSGNQTAASVTPDQVNYHVDTRRQRSEPECKTVLRSNPNSANLDFRPHSYRSTFSNDSGYYTSSNRASLFTLDSVLSSNKAEDSLLRSDSSRQQPGSSSTFSHGCPPIPETSARTMRPEMSFSRPQSPLRHNSTSESLHSAAALLSIEVKSQNHENIEVEQAEANWHPPVGSSRTPGMAYSPPHGPLSPCILAKHQPSDDSFTSQDCTYCGATRLHHLATIATTLTIRETKFQLYSLRELGISINTCDMFGNSPLHFLASCRPSFDLIETFINAGADRHATNNENETFLHVLDVSALGTDIGKVLQLFVQHVNSAQQTRMLLRSRSHQSRTILHCLAAQRPEPQVNSIIVDWFKGMHVNVQARDNQGRTPWHYFADEPQSTSHKRHKRPISDEPANIQQLQLKNLEMEGVIDNCAGDPFSEDRDGHNSLACLAYIVCPPDMRASLMDHCLSHAVDVDHFDKQGRTPIQSFILKPRSCGPSTTEDGSTTAFFVAKLLNAGASVNLRNRNGETALHLACKWGRLACTRLLLRYGADPNAVNAHGRGVLAEASTHLDFNNREEYARISECMGMVSKAGGEMEPPGDADRQTQRRQDTMDALSRRLCM
ncbi:MAG: hypothetical protein Q9227_009098 [Pyrenula ochraceoflavens]